MADPTQSMFSKNNTYVSIGLVVMIAGAVFWIASLAKDVESLQDKSDVQGERINMLVSEVNILENVQDEIRISLEGIGKDISFLVERYKD